MIVFEGILFRRENIYNKVWGRVDERAWADERTLKADLSHLRGDYHKTSDVDLAIVSNFDIRAVLLAGFEASRLPYMFDVVLYGGQHNQRLRDAINHEGKLLLCVEGERIFVTIEQIRLRKEDYHHAFVRLQAALRKDVDMDDMYLDAAIQRFEFCFAFQVQCSTGLHPVCRRPYSQR